MERTSGLKHDSVMLNEVLSLLQPAKGGLFIDCTVGGGGHARALLAAGAGRLLAIDRDAEALPVARETLGSWRARVELVHSDFRAFSSVLTARGIDTIDGGAIADLGFSSMQLEGECRGFSFRRDEPLDMRMDRSAGLPAAEMLKDVPEKELADVIYNYGGDRYARRIARAVVSSQSREPITSTSQLATLVRRAIPRHGWQKIDPATRTFQALRIWVNRELEGLEAFLAELCRRLHAGARIAILSFHSLEDRIVKRTFRELERTGKVSLRVLTKRPIRASAEEVARNPRARSAKLRAAERLA